MVQDEVFEVTMVPGKRFVQVPLELLQTPGIDMLSVGVYAALASFADFGKETGARPSLQTLVKMTGMSRRGVTLKRARLRQLGWIGREQGREGKANEYQVFQERRDPQATTCTTQATTCTTQATTCTTQATTCTTQATRCTGVVHQVHPTYSQYLEPEPRTNTEINTRTPSTASPSPASSPRAGGPEAGNSKATSREQDIAEVFQYWQQQLGYQDRKLTKKAKGSLTGSTGRWNVLNARLEAGFTVAQLKQVVDFAKHNAFLQGDNDSGRRYDDVFNLFRNDQRVESYLAKGKSRRQLTQTRVHTGGPIKGRIVEFRDKPATEIRGRIVGDPNDGRGIA